MIVYFLVMNSKLNSCRAQIRYQIILRMIIISLNSGEPEQPLIPLDNGEGRWVTEAIRYYMYLSLSGKPKHRWTIFRNSSFS